MDYWGWKGPEDHMARLRYVWSNHAGFNNLFRLLTRFSGDPEGITDMIRLLSNWYADETFFF